MFVVSRFSVDQIMSAELSTRRQEENKVII